MKRPINRFKFQYTSKNRKSKAIFNCSKQIHPVDNVEKLCKLFRVIPNGEKMWTFPIINRVRLLLFNATTDVHVYIIKLMNVVHLKWERFSLINNVKSSHKIEHYDLFCIWIYICWLFDNWLEKKDLFICIIICIIGLEVFVYFVSFH